MLAQYGIAAESYKIRGKGKKDAVLVLRTTEDTTRSSAPIGVELCFFASNFALLSVDRRSRERISNLNSYEDYASKWVFNFATIEGSRLLYMASIFC